MHEIMTADEIRRELQNLYLAVQCLSDVASAVEQVVPHECRFLASHAKEVCEGLVGRWRADAGDT